MALAAAAQLSALLDSASEALLLFDAQAQVLTCNAAAMRLLGTQPGAGIAEVVSVLPAATAAWVQEAWHDPAERVRSPRLLGADGEALELDLWRSQAGRVVRLHVVDRPGPALPEAAGQSEGHALLKLLWVSAQPMTLQDERYRFVDVNDAYLAYTGFEREQLVGTDPLAMQPAEDQATHRASRVKLTQLLNEGAPIPMAERRFTDASGRERWFRAAFVPLTEPDGRRLVLSVLNDATAEHVARAQAERSLLELSQWFDLSSIGMLVFDRSGLIVRSNAAFERLVGDVPVSLVDGDPNLQRLLGWRSESEGAHPGLVPGAAPRWAQALWTLADGRRQRLAARVTAFAVDGGPLRYMAVVEDRSAEDERDLAVLERGALMNSTSIGVATFDPKRGWLAKAPAAAPAAGGGEAGGAAADLLAVNRERVMPASRADYERLQQAMRELSRAEARYAVHLPGHGLRWLHTRVEPGQLPSGAQAVSVVTLDVTEQEQSRRRNEQLLRELTTILDGSEAGIAYVRGPVLVRCNNRFERILGLAPGAAAGVPFQRLFAGQATTLAAVREAQAALAHGRTHEAEIALPGAGLDEPTRWYALSLRRADADSEEAEAVVLLSDITRLKEQQRELQGLLRAREAMFELSEVGIVHWRQGRPLRANAAMSRLTGYGAEELGQLTMADLHESRSAAAAFDAQAMRALGEHGSFTGERWLRQRDGRLRWVQVGVRAYSEGGIDASREVIVSYVDLDERQRARQALQSQAQRTRAVLDSVLVGIVTATDGRIDWMNRSARRMFAAELADLQGASVAVLASADDFHPLKREDWPERLADGRPESFECRLRGRDGREFWVVGNAVLTPHEGGSPQVTFALLDIERRRQAEARIAQAQASLQRIIETAPLAIALFDAESGRLLQMNQRALHYLGLGRQDMAELVGRRPQDVLDPSAAQDLLQMLQEAARSGDAGWRGEQAQLLADGRRRVWDVRIVTVNPAASASTAGEMGEAGQWLLVASDVSAQRAEDQARLDAAVAQRERLVKEVHHRIKNNLQGVAGLLQNNVARYPALAVPLQEAIGQVNAIAQVYGLQVGAQGPLPLAALVHAVAASVQRANASPRIALCWLGLQAADEANVEHPADGLWDSSLASEALLQALLPEAEAIPVALALNELLANAQRHGKGPVRCSVQVLPSALAQEVAAAIEVRHAGALPEGFDLQRLRAGVYGLGLVKALLPRRGAALVLQQQGEQVVARLELRSPCLRRPAAEAPATAAASASASASASATMTW